MRGAAGAAGPGGSGRPARRGARWLYRGAKRSAVVRLFSGQGTSASGQRSLLMQPGLRTGQSLPEVQEREGTMQLICISRGTLSGGRQLAERLAKKLGCVCLSREELIEKATEEGIQVGKLEMAMVKPRMFSEQLAIQREYYLAFSTAYLCDRALEGRLVYHGRTGHLLLPGIDHVLSVRVVADPEQRIRRVMQDLGLDRDKASRYVRQVDEDRRRWARSMYGVGWEDAAHYDVVINLRQMSLENAASALVTMAELPDFQMTPASRRAMLDLRLAAKARVALARHQATRHAKFTVRADDGLVTVTYLPKDAACAPLIREALATVEGIREIRSTMATTNILWIQERFDPDSEIFGEIVELATKWNAAVELLRLAAGETVSPVSAAEGTAGATPQAAREANGGIEEDVEEPAGDDGGLKETLDALAAAGRSGGGLVVAGEGKSPLEGVDRSRPYSLVVIGQVYLDQPQAARLRMTRDLQRLVGQRIAAPVVAAEELGVQYLFGRREVARLATYLALTAMVYLVVFVNQDAVVRFLFGGWGSKPWASLGVAAAVFGFVPFIAHCYGAVAKAVMKLIKME
ncbi:MAG TPA: cytidylate kinase-like family protein [Planctomycetaceae bacterium]|nr:cytidylate kinase-like family protein [Planctomycetaceae bacterium]